MTQLIASPTAEMLAELDAAGWTLFGIEATRNVALLNENIDPQHGGMTLPLGRAPEGCSAAEYVFWNLAALLDLVWRTKCDVFVTDRLDADSVAAYVQIKHSLERLQPFHYSDIGNTVLRCRELVHRIGDMDAMRNWRYFDIEVQAINQLMLDRAYDVDTKVQWMEDFLRDGSLPQEADAKIAAMADAFIVENHQRVEEYDVNGYRIVQIISTVPFNVSMYGYSLGADIVVLSNPDFRGTGQMKHTIAMRPDVGDLALMRSILDMLDADEEGWGGQPLIIGSPQGVSSTLTPDEVLAIVGYAVDVYG